jgi:hypothetical protein
MKAYEDEKNSVKINCVNLQKKLMIYSFELKEMTQTGTTQSFTFDGSVHG